MSTTSPAIASRLLGSSLLLALAVVTPSLSQETEQQPPTEPKARFDAAFADYNQAIRDIEQLRIEFEGADDTTRVQINSQLSERVATAQEKMEALLEAAIDVYREAPNQDEQILKLLVAVATHHAIGKSLDKEGHMRHGGDQYEKALPILSALIEGAADRPLLPIVGFFCAFVTNDYDLAKQYLQVAKQRQESLDPESLNDPAQQQLLHLAMEYGAILDEYQEYWTEEQALRAAEAEADDLPRVKISTTKGDVVVELFENEAPNTVANFVTLVKQGFYDGRDFHRVLPAFMAQGGSGKGPNEGGPGYSIACECHQPNYRKHFRGSLSMAHAGRDTGGAQFFLTFVPTTHLNGAHTVFGRVIDGIEVLGEIQHRNPQPDPRQNTNLPVPDKILKAEVLRDRGHAYEVEKLP